MARPGRPASESHQSACCSVTQSLSYSSQAGLDEDDRAPIFSLSKSSMDVVMATDPPHKRDPAWTRLDLRRSSSTNTHSQQNAMVLQQLHPNMFQPINPHQLSLTTQNLDLLNPPALTERWISSMQRWSGCSGSTHSRSSTPETVVWRGGSSRPCSFIQETPCCAAPDSPMSKLTSPLTTPSPFISPLNTPPLRPTYPVLSPLQPGALCEPSPLQSDPTPLQSTEDEIFLENNVLSFQFPSPIPSSVSLTGGSSDQGCLVDEVTERMPSVQLLEGEGSPVQTFSYLTPSSLPGESRGGAPVCRLELPWQPEQSFPGRLWRSPLVSSLSDSQLQLGSCCRCNLSAKEGAAKTPLMEEVGERATMTSQLEMVDTAVQTVSPVGSWWDIRKNPSTMGSHSLLGSPPGSRLNLKASVGSNSNLVSPSSSMFPVSSGEEEEKQVDDQAGDTSAHDPDRRRSCLKMQVDEKDDLGRRSSMKQVQWDEDGMTWEVHGTAMDPQLLSTAIQKHLDLQNSPKPPRRSSKKKRAPKPPVPPKTKAEMSPPVVASREEVEPEDDGGKEAEQEEGGKKEETPQRRSRAEGDEEEDDEVYGEAGQPKSPSRASGQIRKKSVIRLRRPGWCGSSRKADD